PALGQSSVGRVGQSSIGADTCGLPQSNTTLRASIVARPLQVFHEAIMYDNVLYNSHCQAATKTQLPASIDNGAVVADR
ncbi:hypothetical protein, partial [Piscinibacter defluvii]|uniref:hypothetical protein n=1 Tax=Piscinibacter defluvii TaxID=1796922 RepID=UPI00197B17D3